MSLGQARHKEFESTCRPMDTKLMLNNSKELRDILCSCKSGCGAKCPCYLPGNRRTVQQCRPTFCRECGSTVRMACYEANECDAYTFYIH